MFDNTAADGNVSRPYVDIAKPGGLWNLLAQGVVQMQIQWAYSVEDLSFLPDQYDPIPIGHANYFTGIRWWPSVDPSGDNDFSDSDFTWMSGGNRFGAYLSLPQGTSSTNPSWYCVKAKDAASLMGSQRCLTRNGYFRQDFYPRALKFTLTLKDSNGIFADGKTFTHIVYIDN